MEDLSSSIFSVPSLISGVSISVQGVFNIMRHMWIEKNSGFSDLTCLVNDLFILSETSGFVLG